MTRQVLNEGSPTAFVLGGQLDTVLHNHAQERARHFFSYLFFMKVLVTHLNKAPYNLKLRDDEGLEVVATDQISRGFRSTNVGPGAHRVFDPKSAATVKTFATDFTRMDAAHFCNLGIKPAFVTKIAKYITDAHHPVDPIPRDFYLLLKMTCGNTEPLPQRVNIGPDRVIDSLHAELAAAMLKGPEKVVSEKNIVAYKTAAVPAMTEYRDAALKQGDLGIAACADCYLDIYGDKFVQPPRTTAQKIADAKNNVVRPVPIRPFVDRCLSLMWGTITRECAAYLDAQGHARLDPNDYRS
jgi:hypothetical protein